MTKMRGKDVDAVGWIFVAFVVFGIMLAVGAMVYDDNDTLVANSPSQSIGPHVVARPG